MFHTVSVRPRIRIRWNKETKPASLMPRPGTTPLGLRVSQNRKWLRSVTLVQPDLLLDGIHFFFAALDLRVLEAHGLDERELLVHKPVLVAVDDLEDALQGAHKLRLEVLKMTR